MVYCTHQNFLLLSFVSENDLILPVCDFTFSVLGEAISSICEIGCFDDDYSVNGNKINVKF